MSLPGNLTFSQKWVKLFYGTVLANSCAKSLTEVKKTAYPIKTMSHSNVEKKFLSKVPFIQIFDEMENSFERSNTIETFCYLEYIEFWKCLMN